LQLCDEHHCCLERVLVSTRAAASAGTLMPYKETPAAYAITAGLTAVLEQAQALASVVSANAANVNTLWPTAELEQVPAFVPVAVGAHAGVRPSSSAQPYRAPGGADTPQPMTFAAFLQRSRQREAATEQVLVKMTA